MVRENRNKAMIKKHEIILVAVRALLRAQTDDVKLLHSRLEYWLNSGQWPDGVQSSVTPEAAYKVAVAAWQAEHYPVAVAPWPKGDDCGLEIRSNGMGSGNHLCA
jgi:hypothetical protein